jgi:HAE1 family hydrophobic/amphiphilic exporter-1
LVHKIKTLLVATAIFVTSIFMVPLLGTEFVPKADFSETTLNFYTPVGSSMEVTEAKARQVEGIIRSSQKCATPWPPSTPMAMRGKIYANVYVRLVDRLQRTRNVDEISSVHARAPAPGARHHRHPRGFA